MKSIVLSCTVVAISTFSTTFTYSQTEKSGIEKPNQQIAQVSPPSVEKDIFAPKMRENAQLNLKSTDTSFLKPNDPVSEQTITTISDFKNIPWQKKVTLGLNISPTSGLGLDVSYRLTRKLSVKTAFFYNDIIVKDYNFTLKTSATEALNGQPQTFAFDVLYKFSSFNIGIDYAPFKRPWFRLLAGAAIYPSNNLTVKGELTSTLKFNDVVLTPEDIGSGQFVVGFKSPINPYVGIGLGRLHPKKRMNVSLDMGAIYKTKYDFKIDVEEGGLIREDNENNAAVLSKNFNEKLFLRVLPNINLRVAYRL